MKSPLSSPTSHVRDELIGLRLADETILPHFVILSLLAGRGCRSPPAHPAAPPSPMGGCSKTNPVTFLPQQAHAPRHRSRAKFNVLDDPEISNTTRKQVGEMKTIIMLSVIVSLATIPLLAQVLNELWIKPGQLITSECQSSRYICFRPEVSFASLR
ncbi:hypothetical protein EAH72_20300 [Pseudomonas caspiana]|nr:hypothetical protein EAH72_20300 [Pseudomonas caspiana]